MQQGANDFQKFQNFLIFDRQKSLSTSFMIEEKHAQLNSVAITAFCEDKTPLGLPVEPDV